MDLVSPFVAVTAAPLRPSPTWNLVLPQDEGQEASDRASQWNSALRPFDAFDVFLVDQIAVNSVRIERCQNQERTARSRNARRAALRWRQDRQLAAEELGAKLPKSPARIAGKLRSSNAGCLWLIGRWEGLGRILEANGDWDQAQRAMVLDLLGTPPDLRAGPSPLDFDLEGRRGLIRAEVELLQAEIATSLAELDEIDREAAEMGFGPDLDGELAAAQRFERTCNRRLEWAREQLRSGRRGPRPDGPGPNPGTDRGDRVSHAPDWVVSPTHSTEEQFRAAVRAVDARKQTQATQAQTLAPAGPSAPVAVVATPLPPVELPTAALPASPTGRILSPASRDTAPLNRRERRSRAAIARREA